MSGLHKCQGITYRVTDADGSPVEIGDTLTDFRGDRDRTFAGVSRGPEYNGTAKVLTRPVERPDDTAWESYERAFGLTVTPV